MIIEPYFCNNLKFTLFSNLLCKVSWYVVIVISITFLFWYFFYPKKENR